MTALRGARTAGRLVLHPVLFAMYPVLFLFSQNLREQVTIDPLLAPLALAALAAAGLTGTLWLVFRDPHSAGVLATAVVALFFSYGHVWNLVGEALEDERYLLILWFSLFVAAIALAVRLGPHRARRATTPLNAVAAALVVFNAIPIAGYQLREIWGTSGPVAHAQSTAGVPVTAGGRDIYYLIFDRYASERMLREQFGFDNRPFLDELRSRGFYIAGDSTANYLKTTQSLASSLNMEYLDIEALEQRAASPDDFQPFYEMNRGSFAVERFLHERGYRYIHLGNLWPPTNRNTQADENYVYSGLPEFSVELLGTTILRQLRLFEDSGDEFSDEPPYFRTQYEYHRYQLDRLPRIPALRGPKFVFAHVTLPHWPYVFDREGNYVPRPLQQARGEVVGYVGQLEYVNSVILNFLDIALRGPDEEDPIIIIQADEGPPPMRYTRNEPTFQWLEATPAEIDMKFQILNAYHLPGVDPEEAGLYPSITPVNSFRVVFNAYFGTDYELLPDRNWVFIDQSHLYDVADVTDRVREGLD